MATLKFTRHLFRYFPDLGQNIEVDGRTVAEVVAALDQRFPGLADYIIDEQGSLRRHVNIFIDKAMIRDRQKLQDPVGPDDQIYIFQALSGG